MVINAAVAMHGILIFLHLPLVSALHNKTVSPFMAKRWGCILSSFFPYNGLLSSLSSLLSAFLLLSSCAVVDIYASLFSLLLFFVSDSAVLPESEPEGNCRASQVHHNVLLREDLFCFFLFFGSVCQGVIHLFSFLERQEN